MLKGMMKALKYGMALCMAVSLSAYIPEIGIQEVKATEVTASAEEKWSGTISATPPKNDGNTYHIYTGEELAWVAQQTREGISFEGKTIILENDIDLDFIPWKPIGVDRVQPFKGTFEGNGKTITNLMLTNNAEGSYEGLFGVTKNGLLQNFSIKNVKFQDSDINYHNLGIVSADVLQSKVINVHVENAEILASSNSLAPVGGITCVLSNSSWIINCSVKNSTLQGRNIGGIVSDWEPVDDETVFGKYGPGGIVNCASINNQLQLTYPNTTSNNVIAGGIVSNVQSGIQDFNVIGSLYFLNNYSTSSVTATDIVANKDIKIGGLIGFISKFIIMEMDNNYAASSVINDVSDKTTTGAVIGSNATNNLSVNNIYYSANAANGLPAIGTDIGSYGSMMMKKTEESMKNESFAKSLTANIDSLSTTIMPLDPQGKRYTYNPWVGAEGVWPAFTIPTVTDIDIYPVLSDNGQEIVYVNQNGSVQLHSTLLPYYASREANPTWRVSPDTSGVSVDANGLVSANNSAVGTEIDLIASYGEITKTVKVRIVEKDAITSLRINTPSDLLVGTTKRLSVTTIPVNADKSSVRWYIDLNPAGLENLVTESEIASIDSDTGIIKGLKAGQVTVVAKIEGTSIRDSYTMAIQDTQWDGVASRQPDFYDDAYHITMASELKWIADSVNNGNTFADKKILLETNIDLGKNNSFVWTPIGSNGNYFSGIFDGQGYSISHILLDDTNVLNGLFGWINNAAIKNLTIRDISIQNELPDSYNGALAAQAQDTEINGVTAVDVSINTTGTAGGLIGLSQYNVSLNHTAVLNSDITSRIGGGLIGKAIAYNGKVINNFTEGKLTAHQSSSALVNLGGIIGTVIGSDNASLESTAATAFTIQNSYTHSEINSTLSNPEITVYTGGLVGQVNSYIALENNYSNSDLTNHVNANRPGGIIGYAQPTNGYYTSIVNNAWNEEKRFENASGEIAVENKKSVDNQGSIIIDSTTLEDMMKRCSDAYMKAASSEEKALVNDLNENLPENGSMWINGTEGYPKLSDDESFTVVLKKDYIQMRRNESVLLEPVMRPYVAGKDLSYEWHVLSGNDTISVDQFGRVTVSDSAITHQSAIIEMIVKEKGAEISRDTAQIVVLEDEAAVQSLTIKDPGVIKVGDTVKLKAEVEPESVDTSGLYFKVKKINDYAEVSADGTLKAYKAGTFTVQAILDGVIAERIITIKSGTKWDGVTIDEPESDGNYIYIAKPSELAWIAQQTNAGRYNGFEGKTLLLQNDIDLNNQSWIPIGSGVSSDVSTITFRGKFNGQGHTIKNLSITGEIAVFQVGLFGIINNSEIENLVLDTVYINCDEIADIGGFGCGSLFGWASYSNISNIKVKNALIDMGTAPVNTPMPGGLGGDVHDCTIMNSSVEDSTITSKENSIGGIIGEVRRTSTYFSMVNCYAKNVVLRDGAFVGGLVGYLGQADSSNQIFNIKNSYAIATFEFTDKFSTVPYVGSLIGYIADEQEMHVENSYGVSKYSNPTSRSLRAGDIIGNNTSKKLVLNNVYYNSETSGLGKLIGYGNAASSTNVSGLGTATMKDATGASHTLNYILNNWVKNNAGEYYSWTVLDNDYPSFGVPEVKSIKVLPVVKEVYPGETLQLEKEILPFGANDIEVKYKSNNPNVVVDSNGLVKISSNFTTTYVAVITMTPLDSKYPASTSTLIVMPPAAAIESLEIIKPEKVEINSVLTMKAKYLPESADASQIKWSLDKGETEAIISEKGILDTGSLPGIVTIRAVSSLNEEVYDEVTLNIENKNSFGTVWDGTTEAVTPVNNQIHIQNPKQLAYIAQQSKAGQSYEGITIILDANLDLGSVNWTPIGSMTYPFKGNFEGNHHEIKNLKITTNTGIDDLGLFGYCYNSTIKNFYLNNVYIKIDKYATSPRINGYGGVIGLADGIILENVHASDLYIHSDIYGMTALTGGLIGTIRGTAHKFANILNCSVSNLYSINYPNSAGGLIGEVEIIGVPLIMKNSFIKDSTLVDGTYTGGLSGWIGIKDETAYFENCYASNLKITNNGITTGLLLGRTLRNGNKILKNCYGYGTYENKIGNNDLLFGLVGIAQNSSLEFENCYYPSRLEAVGTIDSAFNYSLINTEGLADSVIKNNITQTPNLVNKLNDWVKAQPNSDDYLTWRVNDSTPELGPKSKITLNQDQLILKTNETAVLNATITGENINSIVAWSSSQPSVASIDENGKITAKIPGRAVITATSQDGQIAQAKIEVQALTTSVMLSFIDPEHTTQLKVGDSVDLQAALQPIDEALTWNSSDPNVIAIQVDSENDKLAKITALKAGTAEVSAHTAEGVKGTLQFTVGNPVTSIQIEGNNTMDLAHPTQKLKGFVNDDATDQRISWSIKKKVDENYEETSDAVISETGTVTVSALGSYQVTAAAMDGTDMTAVFTIEVVPAVVDSVKIILPEGQGYLSGQIGSSIDLKAEVTPSLVLAEDAQLHYESSDPTRFMIIEEDGQTKVKISDQAKIGDLAQITLTSGIGKDSNVMDTVTVMVAWTKVESLTIINTETNEAYSEEVPTDLGKGSIIKLKAKPTPEAATNPSVTWRVENVDDTLQTPLAEIDENGYLTLKTPGEIRVTATSLEDGTIIANARINIVEIYPTSISILEGSKEIGVDQNIDYLQLTVNFEPAETTNKKLIFTSSNPAVASVDSMGRITFVKGEGKNVLGDTEITITPEVDSRLDEALQAKPIKITIKVSDQVIYVESIDEILTSAGLPLADTIVRVGDDLNLIASYLPTHASARNFEWEVVTPEGEEALASIHDGKLTALKAGTATIRCSVGGKNDHGTIETLSIEREVVIQEAVARSISFDALSLTLMPGVSQNITASVNPIGKVSQKIKWSSSNSQIIFTDLQGTALNGAIEGPVKIKANENAIAGQTITVIAESEALDIDGNPLRRELQVFIGNVKATAVMPNRTAITMVAEGDTQQLRATVYGANGLKATNQNVTWSSDYPEIASVDAFGTVTPHRAGTAKITVTSADGGFSAVCTVTVTAASLKELKLSETSITMIKGNEKELTAIVNEGSGITDFLWESSEPSIVEIKGSGKTVQLIAKAPGSAVITVTAGNKQASAAVRVVNNEVLIQSIELSGPASGEVGETVLITASIQGTDGNEATNKTLKWHVSDNNAVTVLDETSSIGRFKINKEAGNVIITAEACDGSQVSAQYTLKTTGITASGLTLNNSIVKLGSKDMTGFDIIATITPESVADKTVTWTVDKQNIIELTANGSSAHIRPAAGVVPGENSYAIITAKTANGKSAQCVVLITEVKLEAIQLGKSSITIIEGDEKELPIQIKPAETTNTELIWEIDETGNGMYEEVNSSSAVQISTMNGIYTVKAQPLPEAMNVKEVTIRARAKANTEIISNLCKITIQEDPLVSIEIIGPTELLVDNSAHYSLLAVPYDALISDVSWQVIEEMNPDGSEYVPDDKDENPELKNHIVQIIQEGVLKGIKEGKALIQVSTGNGISAQLEITVTSSMTPPEITDSVDEIRIKKLPDGIEIDSLEMISSEIKQLGVAFYNHGTLVSDPKASEIIWSCSDETGDYLTIDPRTGVITAKAVSPKPITITALSKYTKQIPSEIEGEEDLTVSVLASIPVTIHEQAGLIKSLSLDPSATSLAFNKKQIMTAYASYTGNKEDLSIQWESSDPTIVKVTPMEDPLQASIETFGKAGTAVIMLTVNGTTAFANVIVSAEAKTPVTSITVKDESGNDLSGILEMKQGTTLQVIAEADEAASNPNLIFSTSEDTIASVDENGLIHALSPGVAMITISPADTESRVSKTLVIQVNEIPEYKISLNKTEITMEGGSDAMLVALLTPSLTEEASIKYEWSISDLDGNPLTEAPITLDSASENPESVHLTADSVSQETNVIVNLKATISEAGNEDKVLTQSCTVHIMEAIASITDIQWTSDLIVDDALTMILDDQGCEEQIGIKIIADGEGTAYVNWTTSAPEIVSVTGNASGAVLKAYQPGTADITVTSAKGGFTKTLKVTVRKVVIESLDFTLNDGQIEVGAVTEGFLVLNADPSEKNESEKAKVQFKSSNPDIASVAVDETGKIKIMGLKEGKATIIAMSPTAPDKMVTADITVVKPALLPYLINQFELLDKQGRVISTHTEIDSLSGKIIVTVPLLTDKSALIARFGLSYKGSEADMNKADVLVANVSQSSGVTVNDYTNTLTYVVKDKENEENTKDYMVLVVDEAIPDKDAVMTSFTFKGVEPCETVIEGNTITVKVDETTDLTQLVAVFEAENVLSVTTGNGEQISGESVNDFSKPLTYILFGKNKKSISYTVKVDTGPELTSIKLKQGENSLEGQWDIERECYVFTVPALVQIDYDQPFILEWTPDTLTHSGSLNLNLNEMQSVQFIYADQFTRTVRLMIVESKADSLSVSPQTLSLKPGESSTVSAVIQPDSASQKVNWTLQPGSEQFLELEMLESSAVQVKVKADAPVGASAVLIAESEADASLRAEVSVFIIKNNADTVKILGIEDGSSDRPAVLKVHQTLQLSAEVYAGDELATNQHVTWSSSDPAIASVSLDGTINALSTGSATIQAVSDDGGIKAEIHLRIEPADLSGITIDKTSLLMIKGSHEQLHVLANEGSELGEIHWTSSDPAIVKVDSEGTITALKSGQAVITAKVSEYEASCTVKVVNGDIKITSIDLSSAAAQVEAGQTFLIQAEVSPEDAGNKILKWTSSDEALIHVVNKNSSVGVLQVRKGTGTPVMITAEAMDGSGTKASIMITPMPSTISGIELSSNFIRLGAKDQEGTLLRASLLPITAEGTITWQTDRSDLISLSSNEGASVIVRPQPGVDARNDNYAIVTASSGDVQAQCVVLLSEIAAESITLEPVSMLLNVDEEQKIQMAFTPENATNTILEWQVLDGDGTAVLISRKGSSYTAVGLKAGEVTLQAVNEEGIISNPIHLSVKDEGLSGLQLIGNDVLVLNDEQRSATQLYALAQPASAVIDSLTWRSEDETIAEVSEEGLVTAVGSGSTEIIASCGAIEASFTIFVYAIEDTPQDIEAEKIRIDTAVTTMQIDDKEYLTVSFDPSDTTNKAVRWESDQPEVIRVEAATGLIEAVGAGEATITVTSLENESIYDTVTITVMERSGITSLSWENEISTLLKGEIGELKAVITGTGEETSFKPVWSSSNPEVITVSAKNDDTASAEIEALAKGTAVIYLMVQDQMITQTITVTETETIPVTTITIDELGNRDYLEMSVNESQELSIHVNEDAADKNLTVTSSDETIATVNGTTIEAISEGIAVITIQPSDAASSVVRKIFVKVMPEPEPEVTLDKNSLVIVAGTAGSVSATSILEATYQWSCEDDTVTLTNADEAAVTIQTTTTQVNNVVLTLSVTVNGNEITRECLLTLIPAPSQSDAAEKIEIFDDKGQILDLLKLDLTAPQAMLTAHVLPETAVQYVNWTSSDPATASVQGSNSAIVTAYKTGSVTLTATTLDGKIQASIPCVITNSGKEEVVIRSIKLKAETQELMIGERAELRVSLDPESQIDQVLFTTSKEGILSIEKSSSGVYVMKGLSEGSVDVTVVATNDLSKKDTLRIIVSKAPAQPLLFKEFTLWNEKGEAVSTKTVIDATQKTILVTVPLLHDKRSLVARYTLSGEGKVNVGGIEQQSGVSVNDYQEAVAYEVIDPEGSHTLYTVLVLNETIPSVNGALKTFKLNGVEGEIDEEAKKVIVKLDKHEDRSRLIAEFTMSDALELIGPQGVQISGESENDYRNGQTMTVIGKNGVSVTYQILVDIGPAVQTMTLSQNGKQYSGIIDAQQDTIRFSALKGQADLSAGFTVTAETSALDPQGVSYETTIQFENGTQTLTITDGNGRSYTYTLMFEETEPESELTLTGMKIGGIECKIEGRIIEVILPYGRDLNEALKVEYTSSEPGVLMIGETTISNGGSRVFGEEKALEVTVKNDEKSKEYTLIVSQASGSAKIEKVILNGTEAEPNEQNELKFTFAKGTDLSQVRAEFQLSDSRAKVYVDHEETVSGTLIDVSKPGLIVVELDGNKEIYTLQAEIDYGPQFVGQITITQNGESLIATPDNENGTVIFEAEAGKFDFAEPFEINYVSTQGSQLYDNETLILNSIRLGTDEKVFKLKSEGEESTYIIKILENETIYPELTDIYTIIDGTKIEGVIKNGKININILYSMTDDLTSLPLYFDCLNTQLILMDGKIVTSGQIMNLAQNHTITLINGKDSIVYDLIVRNINEGPIFTAFYFMNGNTKYDGIIDYKNNQITIEIDNLISVDEIAPYFEIENADHVESIGYEMISGDQETSWNDFSDSMNNPVIYTVVQGNVRVDYKIITKYKYIEGDLNGDGFVDIKDMIHLQSLINSKK